MGGRPPLPSDRKRDKTVTVRFSGAEYTGIESKAKRANLAIGKYLRCAAMSGKFDPGRLESDIAIPQDMSPMEYVRLSGLCSEVRQPLTPEEVSLIKELSTNLRNIGTNLNIVAMKAGSGLPRDYRRDLRETMDALRSVKDHFTNKLLAYGRKDHQG